MLALACSLSAASSSDRLGPADAIVPPVDGLVSLADVTAKAKVAAAKAARAARPSKPSVADLTEKQTKGTEITVTYRGLEHAALSQSPEVVRSKSPAKGKCTAHSKSKDCAPARNMSTGRRCGLSWDDAAVKCGTDCVNFCMTGGACYDDLPICDKDEPAGQCVAIKDGVTDAWCREASTVIDGPFSFFNKDHFFENCICEEVVTGPNTEIEPIPKVKKPSTLPNRTDDLVEALVRQGSVEAGLPECAWQPAHGMGCSNVSQYECMVPKGGQGVKAGQCSDSNWYYRPEVCKASCVHVSLLNPPPYYAIWRYGARAHLWGDDAKLPHYAPKPQGKSESVIASMSAHFEKPRQIIMSTYCKSEQIAFVGVSFFSPNYLEKAERLLDSCNQLGVCCKATEMRSDFLGESAPEGSDAFRFQMIALKPAFLLYQLEQTKEPVVFLDVDLEFHKFPDLFTPGSWPEGARDVALFNFWANETNLTYRHTPNVGSAVAYFNQTYRSKALLTAWAEAMQYSTNSRAPDDQVLDKLLTQGQWMNRVSLGWLPTSYLRLMPAYYRGVDPVIDHDRGTQPGVAGHSHVQPVMPPVQWKEKVDPKEIAREKASRSASPAANPAGAAAPVGVTPLPVAAPVGVTPLPDWEAPVGVTPLPVAAPVGVTPLPVAGASPEPSSTSRLPPCPGEGCPDLAPCKSLSPGATDEWCTRSCASSSDDCPKALCKC